MPGAGDDLYSCIAQINDVAVMKRFYGVAAFLLDGPVCALFLGIHALPGKQVVAVSVKPPAMFLEQ